MAVDLSPNALLAAYTQGIFPMADEHGRIHWYTCDPRAIIEWDRFHVPRTLRQVYRQKRYTLTVNREFRGVIDGCADRAEGTWISTEIRDAYCTLHELGFAHSVEAWRADELVGGLYGVAIGGAFFGESMFHRATDASKVALVYLVRRLRQRGFVLLDTQFITDHLKRFGCVEISGDEYMQRLGQALMIEARFDD